MTPNPQTAIAENLARMATQIALLERAFISMATQVSPLITIDEMRIRYDCVNKTLKNMEREGKIPFRKPGGKWSRVEVIQWEISRLNSP